MRGKTKAISEWTLALRFFIVVVVVVVAIVVVGRS